MLYRLMLGTCASILLVYTDLRGTVPRVDWLLYGYKEMYEEKNGFIQMTESLHN